MKNLLGAASAAAILLAAGAAFAQAPAPGGPAPGAPTPAPGFGIQGDAAAPPSVDTIVAALGNTEAEIGKLATLPADATVEVVELDGLLGGADAGALTPAITAAEGQAEAIQTALEGNQTILAQLESQNVEIEDVVGFGIEGSNVLVFVRQSTGNADANPANAPGGQVGAPPPVAPAP
jgi:hypothetical protein